VLSNIHPLLTGELLLHLDRMGHSDAVVLTDAHFPAWRIGTRVVDLPGISVTDALAAIVTVLPLDDAPAVDVMTPGERLAVHDEIATAAGVGDIRLLDRYAFYEESVGAYLFVRTGETRTYANALVRKGIVVN
jgi:L-fucose mutarotase